jgi:translocation and assembly module TamA
MLAASCTVRVPLGLPTRSPIRIGPEARCGGDLCTDDPPRPDANDPRAPQDAPDEAPEIPPALAEPPGDRSFWVPRPQVEGLDALPPDDRAYVSDALPSFAGAVLSARAAEALRERLVSRLNALGYLEAVVDLALETRADTPPTLALRIAAGPLYVAGELRVVGVEGRSAEAARRAAGFAPGARLAPRSLETARDHIRALGVFSSVEVELGPPDPASRTVPILVRVEPSGDRLELRPLASADSGRHVGRLRALYSHPLTERGLQVLSVTGSLGWAFAPNVQSHLLQRAQAERRGFVGDLGLELTLPQLLGSSANLMIAVDATRDILPAYTLSRLATRALLPLRLQAPARLVLTPSLELEQYLGLPTDAIIERTGTPVQARSACGSADGTLAPPDCRLFFAALTATWDGRDDRLSPRRGLLATGSLRVAGTPLSESGFVRLDVELRGYLPLSTSFTLLLRGRLAALEQLAGSAPPEVALLYSGGASSVRTTGSQQLGPRDYVVLPDPTRVGEFVAGPPLARGGRRVWEASTELRWRTPLDPLSALAFFDAGEVLPMEGVPAAGVQFGPGLGLRYVTSAGTLGASVAYRLAGRIAPPVGLDLTRAPAADPNATSYAFRAHCTGDDYRCRQEALLGLFHVALSFGPTP